MASIRVALVGASGYTGAELLRLLLSHPDVELTLLCAHKSAGQRIDALFPQLTGRLSTVVEPYDGARVARDADVAFVALPHGESGRVAGELYRLGMRLVLDLSGDLRISDPAICREWYGHADEALLAEAVYGLPELGRARLDRARLVAVPGCYPTASILALFALLEAKLVAPAPLIVDAKSGVSGAGRTPALSSHLPEAGEGVRAYKVAGTHRHTPEIEQALGLAAGTAVRVSFSPHLLPMSRGILATAYAVPTDPSRKTEDYLRLLRERFTGEPFVRVVEHPPDTAHVRGSNLVHLGVAADRRAGLVVAMTALDNLVKGASGQAIQCMNRALGLPEAAGLGGSPMFP